MGELEASSLLPVTGLSGSMSDDALDTIESELLEPLREQADRDQRRQLEQLVDAGLFADARFGLLYGRTRRPQRDELERSPRDVPTGRLGIRR